MRFVISIASVWVIKQEIFFEATKFQRAARKLIKSIDVIDRNKAVEKSCGNLVRENEILNQKFDIVFVINGHYISNTVYEYLKKIILVHVLFYTSGMMQRTYSEEIILNFLMKKIQL